MKPRKGRISRRRFAGMLAAGAGLAVLSTAAGPARAQTGKKTRLLLGGPAYAGSDDPGDWVEALRAKGYRAAYCPLEPDAPDEQVRAFEQAARSAGIVIAENGAWSNPLSDDEGTRAEALDKCKRALDLADRIGALCCVNISGSRGEQWDGPDPRNLTDETFEMIVATVREIVDEVSPARACYTLETMPWAYPDSPDSCLRLIRAIDRKGFAAHLDPVNMINSPQRYYGNRELLRESFRKLGPYLKACHAKDTILRTTLTTHIDETRPGTGGLDYGEYLRQIAKLPHVPLMLEHLESEEEYDLAAKHVRSVASKSGLFEI